MFLGPYYIRVLSGIFLLLKINVTNGYVGGYIGYIKKIKKKGNISANTDCYIGK